MVAISTRRGSCVRACLTGWGLGGEEGREDYEKRTCVLGGLGQTLFARSAAQVKKTGRAPRTPVTQQPAQLRMPKCSKSTILGRYLICNEVHGVPLAP